MIRGLVVLWHLYSLYCFSSQRNSSISSLLVRSESSDYCGMNVLICATWTPGWRESWESSSTSAMNQLINLKVTHMLSPHPGCLLEEYMLGSSSIKVLSSNSRALSDSECLWIDPNHPRTFHHSSRLMVLPHQLSNYLARLGESCHPSGNRLIKIRHQCTTVSRHGLQPARVCQ